jgi:hypothetical protein
MNDEAGTPRPGDEALERRARQWFERSVGSVDPASRARLAQSRRRAVDLLAQRREAAGWRRRWLAGGAIAAGVVAVTLLLRGPADPGQPLATVAPAGDEAAVAPLDALVSGDDLTIASDAEFYAWIETDSAGIDVVNGQT